MTKKFGDHPYDKYITDKLPQIGRYVVKQIKHPCMQFDFPSVKEARRHVGYNPFAYQLASVMVPSCKPIKAVGVQARPAAAPAAKVHVPKGGGKKLPPMQNSAAWPFPQPTTTTLPLPKAAANQLEKVTINGVLFEIESDLNIELLSGKHIRITKI